MNKEEIIEKIEYVRKYQTETDKIEIKSAKGGFPKKCYDTFSSFSNKYGGIIIFGLSEENGFETEGVYDINDLQKQIGALCNDMMEPKLRIDILPMEFESKKILAVNVEELNQNEKPCYYKPRGMMNGSYIRDGDRDDLMTEYEIYTLLSYKNHVNEDKRPTMDASIRDLDIEKIEEYFNKIKENKPNFSKNSFESNLKSCGIMEGVGNDAHPTLAGTLLFAKYPQEFYPGIFIACSVIPGLELGDVGALGERFTDNKRVEGTIEQMLNDTMVFLRKNMKKRVIVTEEGKRNDKTEYPLEALREAVSNALSHRDYSFLKERAYISVFMFDDRIEISSPGALYGSNKIEDLGTGKVMDIRNPIIVRILEENNSVIENRHTGIKTMRDEMKSYNLPEPEFYNERDYFKVVFRNNNLNVKMVNDIKGKQIGDTQSDTQSDTQIMVNKDIIEKVLEYCKVPRTAREIRELLNISSKRYVSYKIIQPLIKLGKLDYTNKHSYHAKNQKYISINK